MGGRDRWPQYNLYGNLISMHQGHCYRTLPMMRSSYSSSPVPSCTHFIVVLDCCCLTASAAAPAMRCCTGICCMGCCIRCCTEVAQAQYKRPRDTVHVA